MNIEIWDDVDLCDACVYFVVYGTVGDASAGSEPSQEQKRTDLDHAALMFNTLGVTPIAFDSTDDIDGSFSNSGCEGCGTGCCHVYTGKLAYEPANEVEDLSIPAAALAHFYATENSNDYEEEK